MAYDWPGNVRELENVIEHAIAFSKSKGISLETLPEYLRKCDANTDLLSMDLQDKQVINLQDALTEVEKKLIQWAHQKTNGNQVKMAEILGVPRTTLRNRLVKLELFDQAMLSCWEPAIKALKIEKITGSKRLMKHNFNFKKFMYGVLLSRLLLMLHELQISILVS